MHGPRRHGERARPVEGEERVCELPLELRALDRETGLRRDDAQAGGERRRHDARVVRRPVEDARDLVDETRDVTLVEARLQRDRLVQRLPARVAEEAMHEVAAARCLNGGGDHLRDVHVQAGTPRVDREPVRAGDDGHRPA